METIMVITWKHCTYYIDRHHASKFAVMYFDKVRFFTTSNDAVKYVQGRLSAVPFGEIVIEIV